MRARKVSGVGTVCGGGKALESRLAQIFKLRFERVALFPASPDHLDALEFTYFLYILILEYFRTLLVA